MADHIRFTLEFVHDVLEYILVENGQGKLPLTPDQLATIDDAHEKAEEALSDE